VDGNTVSGQNQNASDETAQKLLSLLQEKSK
jgi:putative intracellular protease/amidase